MTLTRKTRALSTLSALTLMMGSHFAFAQNADQSMGQNMGQEAQNLNQESGASVVMYHRFGEGDMPTTNTTLVQIDAHIAEIKNGEYTPLALSEMVRRLKAGDRFPQKSIGVSIDDAYLSVYTEAWPRLKAAGIPFTIFVATDPVDAKHSRYMSWDQIREIAADPMVTIGSQTASHLHMIDADDATNDADLKKSNRRFREELGYVPDIIAYPYGEFDGDAVAVARQNGFIAGFGQHSGAFGLGSDIHRLSRFAMNEHYGDIARLRTAAGALPVPVSDFTPSNTVVGAANNPPAVGFTLSDELGEAKRIACFSNHEGQLKLERLGPRVEVRMTEPLPKGRTRLNCTLPMTDANGELRWRWLGKLFYVK